MPRRPAAADAPPVLRDPLLFALIFSVIFILHAPLLRLAYFWDEAGYYVPAARDLLLTGDPIPHSTVSNAHPPLVMAWLAAWWKLSNYVPSVTRTAMLLVAAFALLGLFRLARRVANAQVAIATVICTALYPVFFTQSSIAHVDLAAAGLTFWALDFYIKDRLVEKDIAGAPPLREAQGGNFDLGGPPLRERSEAQGGSVLAIIFFSLAALAKETAIITPLALFAWELACMVLRDRFARRGLCGRATVTRAGRAQLSRTALLLVPLLPLAAWFAYHYHRTGYLFGNPEFFRYNIASTLHPLRILIALGVRLWQLLGYMNLFVLTIATAMAMTWRPLRDGAPRPSAVRERHRIALPVQTVLYVVILAHVVVLSVIGGAVLARYLLPVTPLVILICVSTLRRRLPRWPAVVVVVCVGFVIALFVNPPWRFAPEDNLAYRDYVLLHKGADTFLTSKYQGKVALTAWPASDELTRPWLGYVNRTVRVLRLENFTLESVLAARQQREQYDVVLAFSTKYEPRTDLTSRLAFWRRLQTRFFDYHRDLPPDVIAQLLAARIVYERHRGGQWIAVLDVEHAENARLSSAPSAPSIPLR